MKVLTANRLTDGEAIWYSDVNGWQETLQGAALAADKAGEERLDSIGKAAFATNFALDVDVIDVQLVDEKIVPLRLRERIRAAGPTNRTDHGKQARAA
ncbi:MULTISPECIES: DUF2849 domain-containing protein [Mesorhizobium]|uniref:DUF2849 domain-containing protein n=1 Tax=Mesorhizobium denitrificans TaxID=2294114 RepID=A0A371XJ87_9HYPH|nr:MULTISPECIES: DUF2849 domain-containing protein [Mesorhizobium]RFC69287.1 DUF2849 domain-containing protein [Mesorhizobium denitrificans]